MPPLLSHAPLFVRDLVRRIDSPAVGMAFDLGHAHVTAQLAGVALGDVLAAVSRPTSCCSTCTTTSGCGADRARRRGSSRCGSTCTWLQGAERLPWRAIAPLMRTHPAPLLMEVAAAQRPDPLRLATVSAELLTRG